MVIHAAVAGQGYFQNVQMIGVQRSIGVVADDARTQSPRVTVPIIPLMFRGG